MKKFLYKVFDFNGNALGVLNPAKVVSKPSFKEEINKGQGEMVITYVEDFDNFDTTLIAHMNIVKVYAVDEDNALGRLIYTGLIEEPVPFVDGAKIGVKIKLVGLVSLLQNSYYKDGANFDVTHTTVDPGAIVKAIIDHFNTIYPAGLIGYAGGNVDNVGQVVTYTFSDDKWLDAIKEIHGYTTTDWWWRINPDGEVYFQDKPASATHTFTIGKDVAKLEIPDSAKKVVNDLRYRDGLVDRDYSDATSQTSYGKRSAIISDTSTTDATTIGQFGNKYIAEKKDPQERAIVVINDAYDLESIRVGDTCKFKNLLLNSSILSDNMQITSISYSSNQVTLELEEKVNLETELRTFIEQITS